MSAGKEIKRLRGKKITAAEAAALIGVGVDRLRKWEERDSDPSDSGDRAKIEAYFGAKLSDLADIKNFDFVESGRAKKDYSEEYIELLKQTRANSRQLEELTKQNQAILMVLQSAIGRVLSKIEKRPLREIDDELYKDFVRNFGEAGSLKNASK